MIPSIVRRQNDVGPPITIALDQPLPGFTVVLRVTLANNTTVDYPGVVLGSTISIAVTAPMTATVGRFPVRLILTGLGQVNSFPSDQSWYLDIVKFGG